jgi:DNA-binding response OmpR family regulator
MTHSAGAVSSAAPNGIPTAGLQSPSPDVLVFGSALPQAMLGLGLRTRLATASAEFMHLLRGGRPCLTLVCAPPASTADIAAVGAERRRRPRMRAMLINGPEAVGERLAALRSGFDVALYSGTSPREISGHIELLLQQAGRDADRRVVHIAPDLALDADARRLLAPRQTIHLPPRECALLEVLGRWPERTFTRRELLSAVGARNVLGDLRTVDVHVRWLRQKLERIDGLPARLVTVRGVGYRLERRTLPEGAVQSVNRTLTDREQAVDGATKD